MEDIIDCDLQAPGFSVKTGYYLAYASNCAYEGSGGWVKKLGLAGKIRTFTRGQFYGFVGFFDEVAILAFRGTQNIGNCLTDAETPLVSRLPYPGLVHHGFADAVEQVWPDVRRLLGPPAKSRPIWVTGHSLGGAMATLASVRLASEGYTVRAVYTYGSPRPGDRFFQKAYSLVNYRFVNDNDLVPHLPFRWCYKHVGELKLMDEHGDLLDEEAHWQNKKRAHAATVKKIQRAHRGSAAARQEISDFDWLSDHHLGEYLEAIRVILQRVPRRRRADEPSRVPGIPIRSRRREDAEIEVGE